MNGTPRTAAVWVAFAVGIGLALAPFAFHMFSRAPDGGEMIDDFAPYMTQDQVDLFRGYMAEIGAADNESVSVLRPDIVGSGALDEAGYDAEFAAISRLNDGWAGIDADMTDLLDRMEANLDNYDAVAALPPFALFPWFFVLPGLLIAGLALWSRRRIVAGRSVRRPLTALAIVGVAVVLAPAVFQMFSRAPQGAEMIDEFRPIMTRERVLNVQDYFVIMGAAEGQMRVAAVPLAVEQTSVDPAARYPAITEFTTDWPTIVGDFSPMVATMSDNVDNFESVDALPDFALFPWFFVGPRIDRGRTRPHRQTAPARAARDGFPTRAGAGARRRVQF